MEVPSLREIPRPHLDVPGVYPTTVLVIDRCGTQGGFRTAYLHPALPAYVSTHTQTHTYILFSNHNATRDLGSHARDSGSHARVLGACSGLQGMLEY